jgi:Mycothiol maleylpyruvate isomerase N-terminal domain
MHAFDVLKYGNRTLMSAIDGLTAEDCAPGGVCGWWSVKDIIAHLASHELVLGDALTGLLEVGPTPILDLYLSDWESFNDAQVDLRKGLSYAQTLDEYKQAHERVMALVVRLSEELLHKSGALPWYGAEYDLEDYFAYGYYGHKREHSAQINVYRDTLKARAAKTGTMAEG